jgi:hypothetical protein
MLEPALARANTERVHEVFVPGELENRQLLINEQPLILTASDTDNPRAHTALIDYGFRNSSDSFATLVAIRPAS